MKSANSDNVSSGKQTAPETHRASSRLFQSFFMGGFECSTFYRRNGTRLDLIASTKHDAFCRQDYERLKTQGLVVAREGLRWHLIETTAGRHNFASALPMLRHGGELGLQILWDLCHYGWPDGLDIFSSEFVRRFAAFSGAFAKLVRDEMEGPHFFTPINEISFFSWAGAESAKIGPYLRHRGFELKCQLVRAAIAAMEAVWTEIPDARFLHVDPVVNVVPNPKKPHLNATAEAYRLSQYQGWDMIAGRVTPELGGDDKYLDIVGVNYYPHNQWEYKGKMIPRTDPRYRPFSEILMEAYQRYRRPMLIAETGTERRARPGWFRYVCEEVRVALAAGVPLHGICLYPILNHPGWVDDRHCHNGLWDYADEKGKRNICRSLAEELRRQRALFEEQEEGINGQRVCLPAA
jgi:beta-glucosidase/6-phospho-beta-glucosidase/beta-galactosidase